MVLRNIDCLIIGAGPTGLTLGIGLLRTGRSVLIAEKHETRLPFSKALLINSNSLAELSNYVDINEFIQNAILVNGVTLSVAGFAETTANFSETLPALTHPLSLPQETTESILRATFLERGGQLLSGYSFDSSVDDLSNYSSGVIREIHLRSNSGIPVTVQCTWLFGCDGAHSEVRKALYLEFPGSSDRELLHAIDATVEEWPFSSTFFVSLGFTETRGAIQILTNPLTVRIIGNSRQACKSMLRSFRVRSILWDGSFSNSYRVVSSYGRGNVWLAGDAAHVHSPLGGRGMNMGIHEALVLADAVGSMEVRCYERRCRPAAQLWVRLNYLLTHLLLGHGRLWTLLRAGLVVVLVLLLKVVGARLLKYMFEKLALVHVTLRGKVTKKETSGQMEEVKSEG